MQWLNKLFVGFAIIALIVQTPMAMAADTSVATFNISGNVPVVFSITARGYPGDLDLGVGTKVVDRLIGIIHFKYNAPIASLTMASSTVTGFPENAGTAYPFEAGHEMYFKATGCAQVDAAKLDGATELTQAGLDVFDAGAPNMADADCNLTASWWGSSTLVQAGKFSMTITVTMVST